MNGYTFVQNVLKHDNAVLDRLLTVLEKQENAAIEFKASFLPKPGGNDEEDACSWNVISDVIAIANSAGGCVLLGVKNNGKYADDFLSELSMDEYKRRLEDHLFNKAKWVCNNKAYSIEQVSRNSLQNCVEICDAKLSGHDVLVIHIRPTSQICPIVYEERRLDDNHHNTREIFAYRSKAGGVAQKMQVPATVQAVMQFQGREIDSDFYDILWQKYLGERPQGTPFPVTVLLFYTIVLTINTLLVLTKFQFLPFPLEEGGKMLLLLASTPFCIFFHAYFSFKPKLKYLIFANIHFYLIAMTVTFPLFILLLLFDEAPIQSFILPGLIFCAILVLWAFLPILLPRKRKDSPQEIPFVNPDLINIDPPIFTLEAEVADAKIWWKVNDEYHGWQLQKHRITGHCRILDSNRVRRAWGWKRKIVPIFESVKEQLRALEERQMEVCDKGSDNHET